VTKKENFYICTNTSCLLPQLRTYWPFEVWCSFHASISWRQQNRSYRHPSLCNSTL